MKANYNNQQPTTNNQQPQKTTFFNRPIDSKVKTNCLVASFFFLVSMAVIFALLVKWYLVFLPLLALALLFVVAKKPTKPTEVKNVKKS